MSETVYSDIRAALTARLVAMAELPEVAWENGHYVPVADAPYLIPSILWAEPTQAELGVGGRNWERGIYQVAMVYPANEGVGPQNAMGGKLKDWFKRGTVLTYGEVSLTIRKAYLNPQGNIVSIAFYCQVAN